MFSLKVFDHFEKMQLGPVSGVADAAPASPPPLSFQAALIKNATGSLYTSQLFGEYLQDMAMAHFVICPPGKLR